MSKQILFPNATVKKGFLKPYTYQVTHQDKTYHILVLKVHRSKIVTVNSKYIWNIKSGSISGIHFKTSSSHLVSLKEFLALENPVIVFRSRPYKTLKYLNESDVIDISNESDVYGIPVYHSYEDWIAKFLKQ